ncbi:MAG: hypothetical protein ACR2MS_04930 [Weeksellaceae bacterium]
MKNIFLFFVLCCQVGMTQTHVNSLSELDNPLLQTSLKLSPGLEMEDAQSHLYYDKNMNMTSKTNAYYTLEKKFHSHNHVIKGVGTYDDGYVYQADQQKLKNYSLTTYYPNGNEAFVFIALHTEAVPKAYYLNGDAIWYRQDGTLMAKGKFDSGTLKGDYIEYDEFGEETKKAVFNDNKIVDLNQFTSKENQRMVGDWVQDSGEWFLDSKQGKELHNEYLADGTLKVYECAYTQYEGETVPSIRHCDENPSLLNYKYVPKSNTQGIVEIYHNGELIEREAITFVGKNQIKSRTVYSKNNPSTVGTNFEFEKR